MATISCNVFTRNAQGVSMMSARMGMPSVVELFDVACDMHDERAEFTSEDYEGKCCISTGDKCYCFDTDVLGGAILAQRARDSRRFQAQFLREAEALGLF